MGRLVVILALLVAPFAVAAQDAAAVSCTKRVGATIGTTVCDGGTQRAVLTCRHVDGSPTKYAYGPVVGPWRASEASCRDFGISYKAVSVRPAF